MDIESTPNPFTLNGKTGLRTFGSRGFSFRPANSASFNENSGRTQIPFVSLTSRKTPFFNSSKSANCKVEALSDSFDAGALNSHKPTDNRSSPDHSSRSSSRQPHEEAEHYQEEGADMPVEYVEQIAPPQLGPSIVKSRLFNVAAPLQLRLQNPSAFQPSSSSRPHGLSTSLTRPLSPVRMYDSLRTQETGPKAHEEALSRGRASARREPDDFSHDATSGERSFAPRSRSRSQDVADYSGNDDGDLSAVMMRGAKDLKRAKQEADQQRRQISLLKSQLLKANSRLEQVTTEATQTVRQKDLLANEKADLLLQAGEFKTAHASLQHAHDVLVRENQNLSSKLIDSTSDIDSINEKLDSTATKLDCISGELAAATERAHILTSEKSNKHKDLEICQRRCDSITLQLQNVTMEKEKIFAQLNLISGQRDVVVREKATTQESLEVARRELDSSKAEIARIHDLAANRKEILENELAREKEEKNELGRRLDLAKQTAVANYKAYDNKLSEHQISLKTLKKQAKESFSLVESTKKVWDEITDLQQWVEAKTEELNSQIDKDGLFRASAELRDIVATLDREQSNTRQVNDLLREKIQESGSNLIEARERVAALEETNSKGSDAVEKAGRDLLTAVERMDSLSAALARERDEHQNALLSAGIKDAELRDVRERIVTVEAELLEAKTKLLDIQGLQSEILSLKTEIAEKTSRIAKLEPLTVKLEDAEKTLHEGQTTSALLQASINAHEQTISDLRTRLAEAEKNVLAATSQTQRVQEKLFLTESRESVALDQKARLDVTVKDLQSHIGDLEHVVEKVRGEKKISEDSVVKTQAKFASLQERHEEQGLTLRATQDSAGTTQEELSAAKSLALAQLADATTKLVVLEERITSAAANHATLLEHRNALQSDLNEAKGQLRQQIEATASATSLAESTRAEFSEQIRAAKADADDKLSRKDLEFKKERERASAYAERNLVQQKSFAEREGKRAGVAESALKDAQATVSRLTEQIRTLAMSAQDSGMQDDGFIEEITRLKGIVANLEGKLQSEVKRAATIDERYKGGDLTDEEKVFVNTLMQMSQSVLEEELVSKGNMIRRRDNTINDLQIRIASLETTVARQLNVQSKANPVEEPRSMINLKSWIPSGSSSSPPDANEGDNKTEEVQTAPALASASLMSSPPAPAENAKRPSGIPRVPPTQAGSSKPTTLPAGLKAVGSTASSSTAPVPLLPNRPRGNFARLAADNSDDIDDFEDDALMSKGKATVKSSLGKREREKESETAAGDNTSKTLAEAGRVMRRRTGVRKPEPDTTQAPDAVKKAEPTAPKVKPSRKRR